MTFRVWLRLLARNRFAVDFGLWPVALGVTAVSILNSALAILQSVLFGRRIARTEIREPPIFVIGHWRTGTTLLHRLLVQDDRFAFATNYDCFAPKSSLVTGWFVRRWLGFLHPNRRPMDNMADGVDFPHEDEFALCSMGLESPYAQFAFPNRPLGEELLDFASVSAAKVNRWKAGLRRFIQQLTLRSGKPIVLKSPPHTAQDSHSARAVSRRSVRAYRPPSLRGVSVDGVDLEVGLSGAWLAVAAFRRFGRVRLSQFSADASGLHGSKELDSGWESLRSALRRFGSRSARNHERDLRAIEPRRIRSNATESRSISGGEKDSKTNRFDLLPETRAEISHRWAEFMREYGYTADATPHRRAA